MALLSILVAVVAGTALGMLWYSPLMFVNPWMTLRGINPSDCKPGDKKGMWKPVLGSILINLVTSLVIYTLLTLGIGIIGVFAVWAGFSLPVYCASLFWEAMPRKLFLINMGYSLVLVAFISQIIIWMM